MSRSIRTILFGLTIASFGTAACSDSSNDAPQSNTAKRAQRQQGVQAADASSKMLALSNQSVGANKVGNRSAFTEDLKGDIEAGVEEFLATVENATCLTYDINEISAENIETVYDFTACDFTDGIEELTGSLTITATAAAGSVDFDYDCDLGFDGLDFDGEWSIDISEEGTGVIEGKLEIGLPDGVVLPTLLEGSWKDLDGECPVLSEHVEVGEGEDIVAVDLSGLDLCNASLCGSDVDIQVADADGTLDVDLSEAGGTITTPDGEADTSFTCNEDGDFDFDPSDIDLPADEIDGTDIPEVDVPTA